MNLQTQILDNLRRRYRRMVFGSRVRAILGTPAVEPGSTPFTVLSMVHPRDLLPYLVAIKSFAQFAKPREVVVVCDPSMGASDQETLQRHIPHVELRRADEFTHPDMPRGGTWERLFAIATLAESRYVVQLDADTVSTGPLDEMLGAVANGTAFVLGEEANQRVLTVSEVSASHKARAVSGHEPRHIQPLAESVLGDVGLSPDSRYVRGCSAFTGFPIDPVMRSRMADFSARMRSKLGARWSEWGTEQVTSNFLVANAHDARVLPYPKYCTPFGSVDGVAFWHFMGSVRFTDGRYSSMVTQAIGRLEAR